jgi:hypothetical protein
LYFHGDGHFICLLACVSDWWYISSSRTFLIMVTYVQSLLFQGVEFKCILGLWESIYYWKYNLYYLPFDLIRNMLNESEFLSFSPLIRNTCGSDFSADIRRLHIIKIFQFYLWECFTTPLIHLVRLRSTQTEWTFVQNAQHNTLTDLVLGAKHMGQKSF